ncbi:MAG: thiamine phosphate synthase [Candidatus Edwardsbacteria bacterium]|nr:thiamine phosphate synthase [Candidatus Edwardsbacteria bacterium]MBU1577362.1 thiamine phosphate synthase [Candidatus Edwardsbacteria bacterium]MBU2463198.1 thiamine phosphate synthase [Candidatus Edwardsbacteria bacterium]MBU2594169.1 thiamine phosphate synthase [Candidatus Edwardsbacteria bacterium]
MNNKEQRLKAFRQIDLYPVTDQSLSRGRSNLEILDGLIAGGARIVQLREKHLSKKDFYQMALPFREKTASAGMLLIINDHLDIAMACGADGVHLGQDDLPLSAARKLAPELLIGVSTHNLKEALTAQEQGADYVNIGPIFATRTKEVAMAPLGPEAIKEIAPHLNIPFTVMGGINASNIDQVLRAGVRRIAVVTAITQAEEVARAVRDLRRLISGVA